MLISLPGIEPRESSKMLGMVSARTGLITLVSENVPPSCAFSRADATSKIWL